MNIHPANWRSRSTEYALVSDEGVVEDGFYSIAAAEQAIKDRYSPEDGLVVDERSKYDEDGAYIEDQS